MKKETAAPVIVKEPTEKRKLSFKEKHEFEKLAKEIEDLETEKKEITNKLNNGETDYKVLEEYTGRIATITKLLDDKEMRWLELSQWMEGS